jgi:hypothetical protein
LFQIAAAVFNLIFKVPMAAARIRHFFAAALKDQVSRFNSLCAGKSEALSDAS